MRRGGLLALGAVAALCGGSPSRAGPLGPDEARASLRFYADCVVQRDYSMWRGRYLGAALSVSPNSIAVDAIKARAALYHQPNCLFGRTLKNDNYVTRLQFNGALLRGEFFRALYRRQFGFRKAAVLQPMPEKPGWRFADDERFTSLQKFGECVVQRDAVASLLAISQPAGSAEEDRAYATLAKPLADCLTPGSTIRFSKSVLEGLLAEGLFHLSGGTLNVAARS